jgi:hypothetical protein
MDLGNDLARIDFVLRGAVAGSVAASSGTIDLDDFSSWRSWMPPLT